MERNVEIIFKKFQFKLRLSPDSVSYAKNLYEDLIGKDIFKFESPYLIVAICIYTVSRVDERPYTLEEISGVCHIKENTLKEGYDRVFEEIQSSFKKL